MIQVGQTLTSTQTLTQDAFNRFAALSGDDNPIHVDAEFSARTRFGKPVAHGMYLYSLICGVIVKQFPGATQVSQELMFPAPSLVGEEVTIRARVLEIQNDTIRFETTVTKASGELGVQGEAVWRVEKIISHEDHQVHEK
ncbi:MAG: MaoC family dehydratase N-terminal domain-containing protein [Chloroflexi bacterium]|nr:MaoC family dehydratase N-terminal domain-containing protein [Chloroflexota bacterium]